MDKKDTSIVMTETILNLPNVSTLIDQVLFEEYQFASVLRCPAPWLASHSDIHTLFQNPAEWIAFKPAGPDVLLVVDIGFAAIHIVPIVADRVLARACKRVNIGGKMLTNILKETLSFRQWNMMEETYVVNEIKEKCCFVSSNIRDDLKVCRYIQSMRTLIFTMSLV